MLPFPGVTVSQYKISFFLFHFLYMWILLYWDYYYCDHHLNGTAGAVAATPPWLYVVCYKDPSYRLVRGFRDWAIEFEYGYKSLEVRRLTDMAMEGGRACYSQIHIVAAMMWTQAELSRWGPTVIPTTTEHPTDRTTHWDSTAYLNLHPHCLFVCLIRFRGFICWDSGRSWSVVFI